MSSGPPEHHLPIPLFPLCLQNTSAIRDRLRGPCDPLIYFLRFLGFLRKDFSVNTSDEGRWLDQPKDVPAQSKSSNTLPLLHSTAHKRALRPATYHDGESNLCAGGSCKSSQAKNRVHLQPHHAQLRKKRNKSNKEPVWRSSTGASSLPS